MIVVVDNASIKAIKKLVDGSALRLRRELAVAVNKTASRCKNIVAKNISKELALPQKAIKLSIKLGRRADEVNINTFVDVKKDGRVNLGFFSSRQTRKGVSYRVSKTAGRKIALGAFKIQKYNGKVYKRKGKERFPLQGMYGPSPWGVHVVGQKIQISAQQTQTELLKQINERIRFLGLKKSGTI